MAAAFFNQLANPQKAQAISAGTEPGEQVHPEVVVTMREIGTELSDAKPQKLTEELARDAQILSQWDEVTSAPTSQVYAGMTGR